MLYCNRQQAPLAASDVKAPLAQARKDGVARRPCAVQPEHHHLAQRRQAVRRNSGAQCPLYRVCHFRSEEHTSELQSLMRISYAVFCLKKKNDTTHIESHHYSLTYHN